MIDIGKDLQNAYEDGFADGVASVECKRGEWITHYETYEDSGKTVPYGVECPFCGRWEEYKEPFCNCGADMRDSDNE